MKNTLKQSIMAVSLVLAVSSFAGFAHANDVDQNCHRCHGHHHGHKKHKWMDRLGITPEQHKQFEAIRAEEHSETEPLMKSMFAKHRALAEYMASPDASEQEALTKLQDISKIEAQVAQIHIMTRFKMKNVLTPEQQQKMSQWHQAKKSPSTAPITNTQAE